MACAGTLPTIDAASGARAPTLPPYLPRPRPTGFGWLISSNQPWPGSPTEPSPTFLHPLGTAWIELLQFGALMAPPVQEPSKVKSDPRWSSIPGGGILQHRPGKKILMLYATAQLFCALSSTGKETGTVPKTPFLVFVLTPFRAYCTQPSPLIARVGLGWCIRRGSLVTRLLSCTPRVSSAA